MRVAERDILEIRDCGLFDARWYATAYPDVGMLGMDPAEHYLRIGAFLERSPGPGFDTAFYLQSNADVRARQENPLLHYLRYGRLEGRLPLPVGRTHTPRLDPAAAERVPVARRVADGRLVRSPGAKLVLVCAHVAGEQVFGAERSLLDILDLFRANGIDTVVLVPGRSASSYLQALGDRSTGVYLVSQTWWRDASAIDEDVVACLASLIAAESVDAVHANTIMLREPLVAARRMGVPAVVHVRELVSHDQALCRLIGHEPTEIIDSVLRGCDALVANSRATAAAFSGNERTFVVPNTVDFEPFDLPAPGHGERMRVGMISSNLPKKGLDDFVAVARGLDALNVAADLVLIGPETTATAQLREDGGLPANLEFAGYLENPWDAVASVDVVVNLSQFRESFGRTVLEAMAGSRPVVAYDWGALPELVVDGETGHVVAYRDVAAVVERLAALAADRSLLRAMGEAGRRRAEEAFSREHAAALLLHAYEAVWADWKPVKLTLPARSLPPAAIVDRPLRIAYFIWWFPAPSETFVLNELRELVAQGHDVEVYCRQSPFPDFSPDFPISWTQVTDAQSLADALVASDRDIVHSHFVYPTVTDMVWPACERSGIDFTFIAHAQDIFRHANDAKNRIGEIAASPRCRRVVVPSRFHRDYLLERSVPRHKLFINPNGMDPSLYGPGPGIGRASSPGRRSVCAVHRFVPKKGLENLIQAAPQLERMGVEVHLYGYGDLEDAYRRLIDSMQVRNVQLHGPVEGRQSLLDVFARHDLFACPSVRAPDGDMDGIPTVVMEAMAAGLPVMVTPLSGIPELVSDGVNGLYCQSDPDSIAQVVGRFFAMPPADRLGLARAARETVEQSFNTARLVAGLVRLWRNRTFDVLVVSWNNLPELSEVIDRLQANTTLPWHLVVCDNGSRADVAAWLSAAHATYSNLTVIYNRDNSLVGPGTNICLEASGSDYAVYVCGKEGFTLEQGWERPLIDYMERNPDVGQAGTLAHSPSYLLGKDFPAGVREYPKFRHRDFVEANPARYFGHVQGGFFILRREMIDAAGGFSDAVPHDYTDVEFSVHVEASGWRLGRAPGMLSLFNKTRPDLFSRIDETMLAVHPPTLEQLPLLDAIAARRTCFCNLCGWHGPAFTGSVGCPSCGSRPADRTLYRFLAESILLYRRLLALGIGVGQPLDAVWREQFRGDLVRPGELDASRLDAVAAERLNGRLDVVYVDAGAVDAKLVEPVLEAAVRLLSPTGVVLLHFGEEPPHAGEAADPIAALARRLGSREPRRVCFRSEVVRYDLRPLWVFPAPESTPCAH